MIIGSSISANRSKPFADTAVDEPVRMIQGQHPRKNLTFPSHYVEHTSIRKLA